MFASAARLIGWGALTRSAEAFAAQPRRVRWSVYYAVIISIFVFGRFTINQFVYVQF